MKIIKLTTCYLKNNFEIEVKDINGAEIKLHATNPRIAGLGRHYDVTIFTDDNKYHLGDIGEIRNGVDNFFVEQLYKQNITAKTIIEKNSNEELYKLILKEIDPKIVKIKNKLELLECSDTDLRFKKITSITNNEILIEYNGHEVGGSYVYDYAVVPGYIKTLEYETNRKVEWTKERKCGIGSDIYTFKVFINKIINEDRENEIILGKRYHIDSTETGGRQSPYAFRTSPGNVWAMLYSISENLNNNKEMPNVIIKEGRIVNIYGIDVFKIIIDAWEKNDSRPNSGRTHFKGTFDLIISENEFIKIYLKLYGELNNCHAEIFYTKFSSPNLMLSKKSIDGKITTDDEKFNTFCKIGYLPITIKIPEKVVVPKEKLSQERKQIIKKINKLKKK